MKNPVSILAVLLPLVLAACENQYSGEVTARIRFAAAHDAAGSNLTTRASQTEGLLIDSATISLQNIRLLVQNSNDQMITGNTVFPGPYMINLITKKSIPVIESSSIAPGTYFGLNALLYVPNSTVPSVYVTGTYTLNDKWWKFYYTNSASLTFQVTDSAGFTVDQSNPEIWVLIDVVSFFKDVDFSKAVVDNDNVIRINESSNTALAVAVQSNFTIAASVSNNPPASKDNTSTSGQSSGGSSSGSSSSSGQGSNSSSGSSSTVNNSNNSGSSSSGSVSNSGGNNQNKDQDKNKEKAKDKQKEKDKNKNGNKSKHDQKDNNKSKDKNKDKDKDKNGH
jgi:hypothetical protein